MACGACGGRAGKWVSGEVAVHLGPPVLDKVERSWSCWRHPNASGVGVNVACAMGNTRFSQAQWDYVTIIRCVVYGRKCHFYLHLHFFTEQRDRSMCETIERAERGTRDVQVDVQRQQGRRRVVAVDAVIAKRHHVNKREIDVVMKIESESCAHSRQRTWLRHVAWARVSCLYAAGCAAGLACVRGRASSTWR